MVESNPKARPDRDRSTGKSVNDEIIPGRHGRHGGSLESEGAPQEPTPESSEQAKNDGADKNKN